MRSKITAATCCAGAAAFCAALFIVLFCFSTGAFGTTFEERFEQTLSAEGVARVVLGNTNGTVRVEGWERDEILVEATKKVRAGDREEAEEVSEALRVEISREDGVVRIETIYPKRRRGGFWDALFGRGVSGKMSVEYEVYVPGKMGLDLTTTNGRVEVGEVSGQVVAHSTNGRIVLRDVESSVRARTTNGSVVVGGLVGTFDVSTTNGSIEVAWIQGGAEDSRAHTTNGRITVRLPKGFSAVLDASTTNGKVRTEIPLTTEEKITKRKVRGTLGEGGPLLKLRTTNGNIDIVEAGRAESRGEPEKRERVTVEQTSPERPFRYRRRGDAVRFVGSVVIDKDEVVEGDAVAIGGSVTVLGGVNGDAVALFGGIKLGPHAVVDGDVVSVGGKIEVSEGARVSGDVVETSWRGVRVSGGKEKFDLDIEALRDRGRSRMSREDVPVALCVRTPEPPVMDGRLDDTVWERAGRMRDFRLSDGRAAQEPTKAMLLWDANYLYVGVRCRDEKIHKLVMNKRKRDAAVWHDDDVEVFLSRDEEAEPYYQFAVNPRGTFYDQAKRSDRSGDRPGWSSDTEVKAYVANLFWSVEMAIPWDDVEGTPEVGDFRRLNIQRKQQGLREYSYWSPTYFHDASSPHVASRFGILRFVKSRTDGVRGGISCLGVEIDGNASVPSEEILSAIRLKVGDALTSEALMDVEDALWDLRWFSDVDVALKDVEKGAVALISVKEHPTVVVFEVAVLGGDAFSTVEIRERAGLIPGRHTEEALDRACERVKDLYQDGGYEMASVSRAYDAKSGRLTVTVDEGYIEEIRIEGARFVEEEDIRDELGIREGQHYVRQGIEEALDGMKQTIGMFDWVSHNVRDGVLTVEVKEEHPVKGAMTARFNRVEGLFIGSKLSATLFEFQGKAYFSGGYGFGTKAWQYAMGAEKSWFRRYRLSIGANSHDVVDTPDIWKVDDDEASWLAICGFEPRDYFRRWGTEVYWTQRLGDFWKFKVSYADDEYESVTKNTDWSLFNRKHTKRLNPAVDEGRMKSLKVSWTLGPPFSSGVVSEGGMEKRFLGGDRDAESWFLWAEVEIAGERFGGDFDFRRAEADVRRTLRLAPDQALKLRMRAGMSEGTLPVQKQFALGGIGTLPGYAYKEFDGGNRMVLANVEYRFGGDGAAMVPFWGAGRVWQKADDLAFEEFKSNVGAALELGDPEDSRLRVSWAIPTGKPARKGRWMLRFDRAF